MSQRTLTLSRLQKPSGSVIITGIGFGGGSGGNIVGVCMCNPPIEDAKLDPELIEELLQVSRYPAFEVGCSKKKDMN